MTYRDKAFKNNFKPSSSNKHGQGGYCSYIVEECGSNKPGFSELMENKVCQSETVYDLSS